MPTLMYDETRRCDAKCYDGKGDKCACVCNGENHGVGLQQAIQNLKKQFGDVAQLMIEFGGVEIPERKPPTPAPVWGKRKSA